MNIEICVAGKNTPVDESYSGLYTASSDPIVDIIVREAIQNSLDAGRGVHAKAASENFVSVDFKIGTFRSHNLAVQLDGITDGLNSLFGKTECSYLAIRDMFTSGLTGALSHHDNDDPKGNPGNLFKLAFTIAQANKDEGAGGSCGVGKTIFYTLGIGIVIFYSRIYEEKLRVFQSRLVVSMIDVKGKGIIPDLGEEKSIGIAWWGDKYKNKKNDIVPITDELRINEFLNIFGISPYQGKETGTTLIIPYIDEKELLSRNNRSNFNTTLDEALRNSVRRWYFPRLENEKYYDYFSKIKVPGSQKWLKCSVNDSSVQIDEDTPLFVLLQSLYNYALDGKKGKEEIWIGRHSAKLSERLEIRVNNVLNDPVSGHLVYCYATKDFLKMGLPDNNPSPREILSIVSGDECATELSNSNEPIIGFCRRAGMIGSYNGKEWLHKVPDLPDEKSGQYMICLFVLNSQTSLKDPKITLDEYLRKSELNDHKDWKGEVSTRIKRNTAGKLSQVIKGITQKTVDKAIADWQLIKDFTDALMPPRGFGSGPSRTRKTKGSPNTPSGKTSSIRMVNINYDASSVTVVYEFKKLPRTTGFSFELMIRSESKNSELLEWSNMGLALPFHISEIQVSVSNETLVLTKGDGKSEKFQYKLDYVEVDKKGLICGIDLDFNKIEGLEKLEGTISFKIHLSDRSVKPKIVCKKK